MPRGLLTMVLVLVTRSAFCAPPNILFIFTDDHAFQAISAYGSKINQTPNLDRIADEGMRFDRCVVTNSICGPSRAAILTGKYSHRNGFYHNGSRFDGSQMTFPKLLRKAGYETAMLGKWHLKTEPTGFDYWRVLYGQGEYYNADFRTPDGRTKSHGYVTDVVTDLALDWLTEGRDPEKPFLLMLQHKAPHREWEPGPQHLTTFDGTELPEPPTLFDDYSNRPTAARNQHMTIAHHMWLEKDLKVWQDPTAGTPGYQRTLGRLDREQRAEWDAAYGPKNAAFLAAGLSGKELVRWKYQRYVKDYLRCIASVDDNVGRVLDVLDTKGLAENTVVVYSSDQGFYLGEHGWYDKRWMYEESFRAPLMVRWPSVVKPSTATSLLVSNLDFAETFLDIADVEIPADMQGSSLVPILQGETPEDWRLSFYYQYYEGHHSTHAVPRHYGVATDRYKLIHYYDELNEWELLDRETDPLELRSEYENPAYAEVRNWLHAELSRLRKDVGHPSEDPLASRPRNYRAPTPLPDPDAVHTAVVQEDITFAEGPALDVDGNLFFVNYQRSGTIGKRAPDGTTSVFVDLQEALPADGARKSVCNGLKVLVDGSLLGADAGGGRLIRISRDGREVRVLADSLHGERFEAVNDVAVCRNGDYYFTIPSQHRALRYNTKVEEVQLLVELEEGSPNGIGVTPDHHHLLINDSGLRRIWIADLVVGQARDLRVFFDFKAEGIAGLPDGMVFDRTGRVYVAMWNGGVVHVFSVPQGRLLETYKVDGTRPTNVHFSAGDLYVTLADRHRIDKLSLGIEGWGYAKQAGR